MNSLNASINELGKYLLDRLFQLTSDILRFLVYLNNKSLRNKSARKSRISQYFVWKIYNY